MQEINLNFHRFSATSVLFVKQGEVGRKFNATITDGTEGYTIPADAAFSVWYSGASGEGNYTKVGDRSAVIVNGNTVTVEFITQMLNNSGPGKLCLQMSTKDGTQLGTWNIPYYVEGVPGMGSHPAYQHNCLFAAKKEVANAIKGSASGEVVALKDVSPIEHEMSVKVDVPGATVQKLGKNLSNVSELTIPEGKRTALVTPPIALASGKTYTFSADVETTSSVEEGERCTVYDNKNGKILGYLKKGEGSSITFTIGAKNCTELLLYASNGYTASEDDRATFKNIQFEFGSSFTGYEPYKEPATYTADENGIVRGIIGNGESMTLLTDTEGVTIEAEYNKDTNKVIESLVQAIISLGGNV